MAPLLWGLTTGPTLIQRTLDVTPGEDRKRASIQAARTQNAAVPRECYAMCRTPFFLSNHAQRVGMQNQKESGAFKPDRRRRRALLLHTFQCQRTHSHVVFSMPPQLHAKMNLITPPQCPAASEVRAFLAQLGPTRQHSRCAGHAVPISHQDLEQLTRTVLWARAQCPRRPWGTMAAHALENSQRRSCSLCYAVVNIPGGAREVPSMRASARTSGPRSPPYHNRHAHAGLPSRTPRMQRPARNRTCRRSRKGPLTTRLVLCRQDGVPQGTQPQTRAAGSTAVSEQSCRPVCSK